MVYGKRGKKAEIWEEANRDMSQGYSYYPNMQFQAEDIEFRFCGSDANQ